MKEELLYALARNAYAQICEKPCITRTELNHNLKTMSDISKNAALSRVISNMLQMGQIRKKFNPETNAVMFWPAAYQPQCEFQPDPLKPAEEPPIDFLAPYVPRRAKKVEPQHVPAETVVEPKPAVKAEPAPVKTREALLESKRADHHRRKTLDEKLVELCESSQHRFTAQQAAEHPSIESQKKVIAIRFSYLGRHGKLRCRQNEQGDMEYWHPCWKFDVQSIPVVPKEAKRFESKCSRDGDDILLWRTTGEQLVLNPDEYRAVCRMYVEELARAL